MKANELRIGNFIFEGNKKEPVKVWGIRPDRRQHLMVNDCEIENIRFVLLNEEWINKFGFKWQPVSQSYWDGTWMHIVKKNAFEKMYAFKIHTSYFSIQYVHELQNLYYALTGNELTYENSN